MRAWQIWILATVVGVLVSATLGALVGIIAKWMGLL